MVAVLAAMAAGVLVGVRFLPERCERANGKLQYILIPVLIFCMGATLGGNPEFFGNLSSLGLKAALFAVVPMAFSVLCVFFATRRQKRRKRGNGRSVRH